ncbi:hypothetical protein ACFPRL_36365 [Pseudoclavibacter helvolus]
MTVGRPDVGGRSAPAGSCLLLRDFLHAWSCTFRAVHLAPRVSVSGFIEAAVLRIVSGELALRRDDGWLLAT